MHWDLFPAAGLDSSLVTAVLIGLYVRFFFTETFGWVFSGLVVPGYLASVAVVLPASACVTVVEAVLTLLCVQGLAVLLSRTGLGTPVFGRDRFLWIVVASIGVRLVFEGVFAEPLRQAVLGRFGVDPSRGFGFFGIGLVLVPLLANACWKPGLSRGLVQNLVTTGVTYGGLRILLATTNLSLGNLQLSFERIAVDFAASPKAYLLLVSGALIASHANLRFGWDTSGIMIPGLLSIGWFSPARALSTLGESVVLAGMAFVFVRLPYIRDWNVEGPRRIVLMFSISYALEFTVLHLLPAHNAASHNVLGVGYLLASLLAVKIWQRRNPALIIVPALTLSLLGLGVGSLAGYGLLHAAAVDEPRVDHDSAAGTGSAACGAPTSLRKELWTAQARVPRGAASLEAPRITGAELAGFEGLVRELFAASAHGCEGLGPLLGRAAALGLSVADARSDDINYVVLRERATDLEAVRGFGLVAIAQAPQSDVTLVLKHPHDDLADADVLTAVAHALRPRAIVFGALDRGSPRGDPNVERDTPVRAAVAAAGAPALSLLDGGSKLVRLTRLVPTALAAKLEGLLGTIERSGLGTWDAELHLPSTIRARLVDGLRARAASTRLANLWPSAQPAAPRARPAVAELRAWQLDVLRPFLRDRELDPSRRARAERAAESLGVSVLAVTGEAAAALPFGADPARDGALVLWTKSERQDALVESMSSLPGMAELASRLGARLSARALLFDGSTGATDAWADLARATIALAPAQPPVLTVVAQRETEPTTLYLPYGAAWQPQLTSALSELGLTPRQRTSLDDRTPARVQALFEQRTGAPAATLAVSREDRHKFLRARLSDADLRLMQRLDVPVRAGRLEEVLRSACDGAHAANSQSRSLDAWVTDLQRYAKDRSPGLLASLTDRAAQQQARLEVIDDLATGDAYLVARWTGRTLAVLLEPSAGVRSLSCPLGPGALSVASQARVSALIVSQP